MSKRAVFFDGLLKQAGPNGLQRFFGGARKVTGFLNNPIQSAFPKSPASAPMDNLKNVASQVVSPKPFGIASNLGLVTQIPGWVGTAGAVNTGINTADQLFEYGEKGFTRTLDDMKTKLNTKHFQNPVLDTGNDILNAASRPLVSVPLGIREGAKAIAPAFKYNPGVRQSSPMHGATALMNMNKRGAFFSGLLKQAGHEASLPIAALSGLLGPLDFYPSYKEMKNAPHVNLEAANSIDPGRLFSAERIKYHKNRSYVDRAISEKLKGYLAGAGLGVGAGLGYDAYNSISPDLLQLGLFAVGGGALGRSVGATIGAKRYNDEVVNNPEIFKKVGNEQSYSPLFSGLAGKGLSTFRQNIPAFINKVKALPKVNYRPLLPLAPWAERQAATFMSSNKLRQAAEPNLVGTLTNLQTNNAPEFKFDASQASAFRDFLKTNPEVGNLTSWALTNQPPSGPTIGPR